MSDFDSMLWRPINNGMQFNSLFPSSTCTKMAIGSGDTDFSIKEMNALVSKFSYQTELVANVLEKDTLQNTCNAIKDFLYNHFQYKADDEDQMLRSPACSWHDRAIGIDCKSYSILASCLLTNLGIKHYIRRIKQQGYAPEQFTHVYVVVPTNQITADLQKGSICIDGTLKQSSEPSFLIKSDLFMNLQHYALNGGLASTPAQEPGNRIDWSKILGAVKNINWGSIKNIFAGIDCWGGSAYSNGRLDANILKINAWFEAIILSMNKNLYDKNMVGFKKDVADLYGEAKLFQATYESKKSQGWNSCSTKAFNSTIKLSNFYRDVVGKALTVYLYEYFLNNGVQGTGQYSSVGMEEEHLFWGMSLNTPIVINQELINWSAKEMVIPAFVITPIVVAGAPGNINTTEFLKELVIVAADFTPTVNTGGGGNPNNGNPDLPANTTQAGFGVLGWLMVGGAILYGVKEFSGTNKPTK